jgi:uncharacterized protein YciI
MADLAQFLYRIVPTRPEMLVSGPDERKMQAIDAHFAHPQRLAADGTLLMAGRTVDTGLATFGIVVLRAPSLAEAGSADAQRPGDRARRGALRAVPVPGRGMGGRLEADGVGTPRRRKTFVAKRAGLRIPVVAFPRFPPLGGLLEIGTALKNGCHQRSS